MSQTKKTGMLGLRWQIATEVDFYREVGRRIRRQRRRANLTLQDVARREGVSMSAVSQWELGASHVSIHTLYRLAAHLEITAAELLPDPTAPWRC